MTDNLTHALLAFFLALVLLPYLKFEGHRKWPLIAAVIAGNIPDLDFILRVFGHGIYLVNHRVLSHSIFGILFFVLFMTFVFGYILKRKEYWKYAVLSAVTIVGHVFLDFITSFGTQIFYPFNEIRYTFSIIPIVDIYILIIFVVGLWFLKIHPEKRAKVAKATLFIFFVFLFFKAGLHIQAQTETADLKDYENVAVMPHMLNPFGWRALVIEPTHYLITDFDPTVGGFKDFKLYPISKDPKVEDSKKSLMARQFLEFSMFPYAFVDGDTVTWVDLRTGDVNVKGLGVVVEMDEDNNIVKTRFGL